MGPSIQPEIELWHHRLVVGRIMQVSRASGRIAWFWTVTGPAEPDAKAGFVGEAEDLDAAKAEFRKAFDAVLCWCSSERAGVVRWHGGSSRADSPEL